MTEKIEWHEEEWLLSKLKKFDNNPRVIGKDQYKKLVSAIEKLGYHHPIAAQPDGTIISGHQRAMALRDLGYKTIRVTVPSRELTVNEYKQMLIQSNLTFGSFDFELLSADFEMEELKEWGLDPDWMVSKEAKKEAEKEENEPRAKKEPTTTETCVKCGKQVVCDDK